MYDFAKTLAQPYPLLLLLLGLAVLSVWVRGFVTRRTLLTITVTWLAIVLLSAPAVSDALLNTLTSRYAPPEELPADVDALVTLGGGIEPPAYFRDYPEVDSVSFGRCQHTAAIYRHLKKCKVVVTGGPSDRVPNGPSVAEVMRDMLVKFDVPLQDILVETKSETTYENAAYVAELLRAKKLKKIVLITDSRHMPRAVMCFHKQGLNVIPAPSDYSVVEVKPPLYESLIPTSDGLRSTHKTFHEWLGMAWYWLHDRI